MRTALDVSQALLAAGIRHEVVRLRRRITTADDLPGALGLVDGCIAVRLYAVDRQGRRSWTAVLVPSGADPDPRALAAAVGSDDVRPATTAETNTVTGFSAGLVSPVPLPPGVEVVADAAIGRTDVVYAAAGEGGVAVGVRTRDLLVAAGARAAALSPAPLPVPGPRFADIVELDLGSAVPSAEVLPVGPDAGDVLVDPGRPAAGLAREDRRHRYG